MPHRLLPSIRHGLLGFGLFLLMTGSAWPDQAHANPSEIAVTPVGNLAVGGFDPVSFTAETGPQLGSSAFRYYWKGANWQFLNAENREAFRATPEAFAPAYGGHGAWAVSVGEFLRGDPRLYQIIDGQVFLFYSEGTLSKWLEDPAFFKQRADLEWAATLPAMR